VEEGSTRRERTTALARVLSWKHMRGSRRPWHATTTLQAQVLLGCCVTSFFFDKSYKFGVFLTTNIVRTLTEHFEPEHLVQVCVHHLPEPNINVQVQVRAQNPRTRTEPNPGQSTDRTTAYPHPLPALR